MLLSVGYPLLPEVELAEAIERYRDKIGEIYFAWRDAPSGRMPTLPEVQQRLEADLPAFRAMGLKLCLLLNGNCYGREAMAVKFAENIVRTVEEVRETAGGLDTVTTASPFVAYNVKKHFPEIETRASVNMRIGTVEGMTYLQDVFDAYYVQREYNRNFARLRELRQWASGHGKKLHGLLNSGCLNFCSNQTFHDNLVAHEREMDRVENLREFNPVVCHGFYSDPANREKAIDYSNWIRPEDLHYYDKIFDGAKIATRLHSHPAKVISAYARRSWPGNLAELLEPSFRGMFIDNRAFAEDWLMPPENSGLSSH